MVATVKTAKASKHQRTCIVCGERGDKRTLYRVVRTPEGAVAFDKTGRSAGRGAYVCSAQCFQKARSTKRLERALKVSLHDDDYDRIAAELEEALHEVEKEDEE